VWVYDVRRIAPLAIAGCLRGFPEGMPGRAHNRCRKGGVWVAVVFGAGEVVRFKSAGTV